MQYKLLGKTGVRVSALCFGVINFFDCANGYAAGRSEQILGRLIAPCRDEVIITSKVFFPTGPDINAGGAPRRHIRAAVEASLKRLNTDYTERKLKCPSCSLATASQCGARKPKWTNLCPITIHRRLFHTPLRRADAA